jgi:predicted outer membrane repeat protein
MMFNDLNHPAFKIVLAAIIFITGCTGSDSSTQSSDLVEFTEIKPVEIINDIKSEFSEDMTAIDEFAETTDHLTDFVKAEEDIETDEIMESDGTDIKEVSEIKEIIMEDYGTECPGGQGCPCNDNSDCNTNNCIETPYGKLCTFSCAVSSCPDGFLCKEVYMGPDLYYICVHPFPRLCWPCSSDDDCKTENYQNSKCISLGGTGKFCGGACDKTAKCPGGFACKYVGDSYQCVPEKSICDCNEKMVEVSAKTQCFIENGDGKCTGESICNKTGAIECNAKIPQAETCDNLDNNCNGSTDENLIAPLMETQEGVCLNIKKVCKDGIDGFGWYSEYSSIKDYEPQEFSCDGLDNDCDGKTDADDENIIIPAVDQNTGVCKGQKKVCKYGADGYGWYNNYELISDFQKKELNCDGMDNDCDGLTDEDLDAPPVSKNISICSGQKKVCKNGESGYGWYDDYSLIPGYETAESICDGVDNDCDGVTDNIPSKLKPLEKDCYTGLPPETAGKGICITGKKTCTGGKWDENCSGEIIPEKEKCDGLDNDCDGKTDMDDIDLIPPLLDKNSGACLKYTKDCKNGDKGYGWYNDYLKIPFYEESESSCDGIDNDCDGNTDNKTGSQESLTKACYDGTDGTIDVGICHGGYRRCINSKWESACLEQQLPADETCNKLDDDCDGKTDNLKQSGDPIFVYCYTGPEGTEGKGLCHKGKYLCVNGKYGTTCVDQAVPSQELCDKLDNDCDGKTDNDDADLTAPFVDTPAGVCSGYKKVCKNGDEGYGWYNDYENIPYYEEQELLSCDGFDNDCDGHSDNIKGTLNFLQRTCYTGPAGTSNKGICHDGYQQCINQEWETACHDEKKPESNESCNDKDDDCDGYTDNMTDGVNDVLFRECYTGPSGTDGIGICESGIQFCGSTGTWLTACENEVLPLTEELCNGKDDDCDSKTDEGFPDNDLDMISDCADPDDDNDTIPDTEDNCDFIWNPLQEDTDKDGIGDACDEDVDGDGYENDFDVCPYIYDPDQYDSNFDSIGDECTPALYVWQDQGSDDNDCKSWNSACKSIKHAMWLASNADAYGKDYSQYKTINVAKAVYKNLPEENGQFNQDHAFQLKDKIVLFGGFCPPEQQNQEWKRDIKACVTVLDGLYTDGADKHVYHVILGASNARVDGFSISSGDSSSAGQNQYGAGLYLDGRHHMTVSNCIFSDNKASPGGGAVFIKDSNSVKISKCSFYGNQAVKHSSGAFAKGGAVSAVSSSVIIESGEFKENSTNDEYARGGAISSAAGTQMSVFSCNFLQNTSSYLGGAIDANEGGSLTIKNSSFDNNAGISDGGGIALDNVDVALIDSYFAHNQSIEKNGGAISSTYGLVDCINSNFVKNSAHMQGGAINITSDSMDLSGCRFVGNSAGTGGAVYSNYVLNEISRSVFTDNYADAGGAIYAESQLTIKNSEFIDNHINEFYNGSGGAIYFEDGIYNFNIINSTFYQNSATAAGNSVYVTAFNTSTILNLFNTIMWHEDASVTDEIDVDENHTKNITLNVSNSDIKENCIDIPGSFDGICKNADACECDYITNLEPKFMDTVPPVISLKLRSDSPCVDAGVNSFKGLSAPATDMENQPRCDGPDGNIVKEYDIGAHEYCE